MENKMRLESYIQKESDMISVIELSMFMEDELLLESKISKFFEKLGFHVARRQGLIDILAKAGKDISQLFYYAIKASLGDTKAKEKVKEIANKEVTKEQIIDFLLRLDVLTLHLLTGPIHMLDALLGWHMWANVNKGVKEVTKRAKEAISNLERIAANSAKNVKDRLIDLINRIKNLLFGEKK
jgi:hypothetical protein